MKLLRLASSIPIIVGIVLMTSACTLLAPPQIVQTPPTPQVLFQGETPGREEIQQFDIDNCNGKADLTRIEHRAETIETTVSTEVAAKLGASAELIFAEVQAAVGTALKRGSEQGTSAQLVAPPGTHMAFQLAWIGDERLGIVQNLGNSSTPIAFKAFIPTDWRLKGQFDIGCPGGSSVPTERPAATDFQAPTVPASPSLTPRPAIATLMPTATTIPRTGNNGIPFSAPDDSSKLNSMLGWQPGGSKANAYDLSLHPGALTLIADAGSDHWEGYDSAPLVAYPTSGNLVARVKVVFSPQTDYQHAGLGIRSFENHNVWLTIDRCFDGNAGGQSVYAEGDANGAGIRLNYVPYADDTVWLQIERRGSLFSLSYSTSGNNWIVLEKDYVFNLPSDVEVFLASFSSKNNSGVVAQFSEFQGLAK
jgi:regulation of enolase protein 1 (concanavalin A-like superfamily)